MVICLTAFAANLGLGSRPDGVASAVTKSREWNRPSLESAAATLRSIAATDRSVAGEALIALGRIELRLGDRDAARLAFQKARQIYGTVNSDRRIIAIAELALLAFDAGENVRAEALSNEALELAAIATETSVKAYAHFAAAELDYFNTELDRSLEQYQKALELWADQDPDGQIRGRIGLGYLYLRQDRNRDGYAQFAIAHDIALSIDDKRSQAIATKSLGSALNNLNQKQAALEKYLSAELMFPTDLDRSERGILHNALGSIYESYRDWGQARRHKARAVDLFTADKFTYGQMATLSNLGALTYKDGDVNAALDLLRRAEKLAVTSKNRYHLALVNEEFGNVYFAIGLLEDALAKFRIAAKTYEQINNARQAAESYCMIARIFSQRGDHLAARSYFEKAQTKSERVRDSFTIAEIAFQLAKAERAAGDTAAAVASLFRSLELSIQLSDEIADSKLQRSFRESVFERLDLFIDLTIDLIPFDSALAEHSLAVVESFRTRTLIYDLRFNRMISATPAPADAGSEFRETETALLQQLDRDLDKLASVIDSEDSQSVDSAETALAVTRDRLSTIRSQMRTSDPIYSSLREMPTFDPAAFRANEIDENTLVLSYVIGQRRSILWAIDKNAVSSHVLPGGDSITSLVTELDRAIRHPAANELTDGDDLRSIQRQRAETAKRVSAQLSDILLKPVAQKLNGKRLLIVPDKGLMRLPFAMLADPNDPASYLVESNEIAYLPSLSALSVIRSTEKYRERASASLIVAAPEYSAAPENVRYPQLNETSTEAQTIADLIGRSTTIILQGANAAKSEIQRADLHNFRTIHFAVHGIVDLERPELTGLVLAGAGGDLPISSTHLGLSDVISTRLQADLVVLSACETAIGREAKADAPQSLTSAFIQAGASTVISSMWKIDDESSSELMQRVYSGMYSRDLMPAMALRQAQLEMIRSDRFNAPYYWAAFCSYGEYGQPMERHGQSWLSPFISWLYPIIASR